MILGMYTVMSQFGYGEVFAKHLSEGINNYMPSIKPYLQQIKDLLNNLKI